MASIDLTVRYSSTRIGDHLLVRMRCRKLFDTWMLLDLAAMARKAGISIDEAMARLAEKRNA